MSRAHEVEPVRSAYRLERAWIEGAVRDDVLVEIEDGRFTSVTPDSQIVHLSGIATADKRTNPRPTGDLANATAPPRERPEERAGLTIPGLANCHSHAFHRALRGRTQAGRGTFWTWREQMYAVAGRLDPDSYYRLALATFKEMVATGITSVGEFHYLHHQPDGTPYVDPNELGHAVITAAVEAGLRITLLDTCYLSSGFGAPVEGVQRRYTDRDVNAWRERFAALTNTYENNDAVRIGAAIHSVRAVPAQALRTVADTASGRPLHVHLSEQTAENDDCLTAYGVTPTRLLADHGALGPLTTVVHATHLTDDDISELGETRTYACFCPTTERDLGDGIGPSTALREAGCRLTLGSDSHALIDLFEEMRAVELDERLASRARGHWSAAELLASATTTGQQSLGWADAGEIAVGRRADLVTLDTTSPRTAGTGADQHTAVFAAGAGDVTHVVVDGRVVARQRDHQDVGRALDTIIEEVWT